MTNRTEELSKIVESYYPRLLAIPKDQFSVKPLPNKWSKKEIVGHLIDSAQNNIQRFIRGQYEDSPSLLYGQNEWVELNNYQQRNNDEIIELWKLLNLQIVHIWNNMPKENLVRPCRMGEEEVTIQWHVDDYTDHLMHHLKQVFG